MAIATAAEMKDALQNGSGHFCPVCRSARVIVERLEQISALHAEQDVGCENCMSSWTVSYAFSEVLKLDSDDRRMGATQLAEKYAGRDGAWGEHPTHPRQDWQDEVANEDTLLGYWEWVEHQLESQ